MATDGTGDGRSPSNGFRPCRRRGGRSRFFLPVRLPTLDVMVSFADGAHERYQLAYSGSIEAERDPGGWHYHGHLSCRLLLYNRAGERFEHADIERRAGCTVEPDAPASLTSDPTPDFDQVYRRYAQAFMRSVVADRSCVEARLRRTYPGAVAISEID